MWAGPRKQQHIAKRGESTLQRLFFAEWRAIARDFRKMRRIRLRSEFCRRRAKYVVKKRSRSVLVARDAE
jgi:hypothetical protein